MSSGSLGSNKHDSMLQTWSQVKGDNLPLHRCERLGCGHTPLGSSSARQPPSKAVPLTEKLKRARGNLVGSRKT